MSEHRETGSVEIQYGNIEYSRIPSDVHDKSDAIVNMYRELLGELNILPFDFSDFLDTKIQESGNTEENIRASEFESGNFIVYFNSGNNIRFDIQDIREYSGLQILQGDSLESIEERIANINAAIESIYDDNYSGLFQGEINDRDVVQSDEFGEDLQGKTLAQLREIYEEESQRLHSYYSIVGDTERREALLMQEIEFFAGVGDRYEGGARYFSLSDEEIQTRVAHLIRHMDISEIFTYIISVNETIDENWRKSDMVNQINGKLIQALYAQTFDRLIHENSPNSNFIEFARIVTGRATIQREIIIEGGYGGYGEGEEISYEDTIRIDDNYKAFDFACRALIYVMYRRPDGVMDEIQSHLSDNGEAQAIVEDEEVSSRNPGTIVSETIDALNQLSPNTPNYGNDVLRDAGFENLVGTQLSYDDLSFEDKINLGAIYRIGEIIRNASPEELVNPNFIIQQVGDAMQDSYNTLNESFSDNFDGWNGIFGGMNAEDLGLTGEFAEIFDLYQDINGNSGFWDWSDANQDRFGNISTLTVLGVGLIAGAIIFAPVLAAGAAGGAMALAGAQTGAIVGIASVALSRQGYDTYEEAIIDSVSQIAVDTASGALFSWGLGYGLRTLISRYPMRNYTTMPDLFFSRNAWSGTGIVDKGFILTEVGVSGFLISPAVAQFVRNEFTDSHFNTDTHMFVDGEIIER